jgi:hypothetical protein
VQRKIKKAALLVVVLQITGAKIPTLFLGARPGRNTL